MWQQSEPESLPVQKPQGHQDGRGRLRKGGALLSRLTAGSVIQASECQCQTHGQGCEAQGPVSGLSKVVLGRLRQEG